VPAIDADRIALPVAVAAGVLLVVWYVEGNELMRRRASRLAWSKRFVDPYGGQQSILGLQEPLNLVLAVTLRALDRLARVDLAGEQIGNTVDRRAATTRGCR
jgi:hypothetical protein